MNTYTVYMVAIDGALNERTFDAMSRMDARTIAEHNWPLDTVAGIVAHVPVCRIAS